MSLIKFLQDPKWDSPFFKILANNDTAHASGHQGGVVIPKDLRQYFPILNESSITAFQPTVDAVITARLFHETIFLGVVQTRYQLQSWGGTRSPEARLTDNLTAIRTRGYADDVLIFQRDIDSLDSYRLILVNQNSPTFSQLRTPGRTIRWGLLDQSNPPLTENIFVQALNQELQREASPFNIFEPSPTMVETRQFSIGRSSAFRKQIQTIYENRCCVCHTALRTPTGLSELEAAHIVPRNLAGADDARNGLALCRQHHWAFDNGLYGINQGGVIFVPPIVRSITENRVLVAFHDQVIRRPTIYNLSPHQDALRWHRENVLIH